MEEHVLIDSVAVRPGHPMALAQMADAWLLGLPGNPQSAIVALLSLGAPLIDALRGRAESPLPTVTLTHDTKAPAHEHRLVAPHVWPAGKPPRLRTSVRRCCGDWLSLMEFVVLPPWQGAFR